jgi:hypothetical protein
MNTDYNGFVPFPRNFTSDIKCFISSNRYQIRMIKSKEIEGRQRWKGRVICWKVWERVG